MNKDKVNITDYKFKIGDHVVLNENAKRDLPNDVGKTGYIEAYATVSPNFDYYVDLGLEIRKVKESEIDLVTSPNTYSVGDKVLYLISNQFCKVEDTYDGSKEVRLLFEDGTATMSHISNIRKANENEKEGEELAETTGKFEAIATSLGKFTDQKNKQYGSSVDATYEMMKALMERYTYDEDNYLMPKSLLQHILLQVRMMDKINRVFNNPSGKGDSESPYKDLAGYSLIGVEMVERNKSN